MRQRAQGCTGIVPFLLSRTLWTWPPVTSGGTGAILDAGSWSTVAGINWEVSVTDLRCSVLNDYSVVVSSIRYKDISYATRTFDDFRYGTNHGAVGNGSSSHCSCSSLEHSLGHRAWHRRGLVSCVERSTPRDGTKSPHWEYRYLRAGAGLKAGCWTFVTWQGSNGTAGWGPARDVYGEPGAISWWGTVI
jgi:hypothetical protein